MKVYLASNFGERFRLRGVRAALQVAGVIVTSRWLDTVERFPNDPQYRIDCARMDVQDIDNADLVVVEMFEIERPQHGKHFELGYAFAKGKVVWVVGDDFHIFHDLAHAKFRTMGEAVRILCEGGL